MNKKLFLVSLLLIFTSAITLPKVFCGQEERIQYEQLKKKVREAKTYSQALDIFRDYLSKYPSSLYRDEIETQISIRESKIAKRKAVEMNFWDVTSVFSNQQYKNEFEERREAPKNTLEREKLRNTLIYSKTEASKFRLSLGEYDFDLGQFKGTIGYAPPRRYEGGWCSEIRVFLSQDGSPFNFILRVNEKDAESLKEGSYSHIYLHIIYTPLKATPYLLSSSDSWLGSSRYEQFCLHIDLKYAWLTIKGSNKIFPLEIVQ